MVGRKLLPREVMTEASLLAEECCASHEGGVMSVTAPTHQQVQSDQVGTCDQTVTSEAGSGVMQVLTDIYSMLTM